MGNSTYITEAVKKLPGFRAFKDKLTLVLCDNPALDFKPKPLLVYLAENPQALCGKTKSHLPIFLEVSKKSWVTAVFFKDRFHNCFTTRAKMYLLNQNLQGTAPPR